MRTWRQYNTVPGDGRIQIVTTESDGTGVYDGSGLRVAKRSGAASCSSGTVSKLYWRSITADTIAETDGTGSTTNAAYYEYVMFSGRRIASRNGTGSIFYYFADQVGSTPRYPYLRLRPNHAIGLSQEELHAWVKSAGIAPNECPRQTWSERFSDFSRRREALNAEGKALLAERDAKEKAFRAQNEFPAPMSKKVVALCSPIEGRFQNQSARMQLTIRHLGFSGPLLRTRRSGVRAAQALCFQCLLLIPLVFDRVAALIFHYLYTSFHQSLHQCNSYWFIRCKVNNSFRCSVTCKFLPVFLYYWGAYV
jgi:hypothetical protein